MEIRRAIRKKTWWYRNCRTQRRKEAKICFECPIREQIERIEVEEGKEEVNI